MSQRNLEKFNNVIKRELGEIFLRELDFPKNILVTITKVAVSSDKTKVKIFIGTTPEEVIQNVLSNLNKRKKYFRSLLGKRLNIRRIPELEFVEDKGLETAKRVEELLKEI
ncbi:30S ribosome-binding factor RbfA [bacterium]|nr:30S ribosome-binding factor RbfA [bacterium]